MDSEPPLRFVTGSLHVDFLKPTPLGPILELRGRVKELKGRKVVVESEVWVDGVMTGTRRSGRGTDAGHLQGVIAVPRA